MTFIPNKSRVVVFIESITAIGFLGNSLQANWKYQLTDSVPLVCVTSEVEAGCGAYANASNDSESDDGASYASANVEAIDSLAAAYGSALASISATNYGTSHSGEATFDAEVNTAAPAAATQGGSATYLVTRLLGSTTKSKVVTCNITVSASASYGGFGLISVVDAGFSSSDFGSLWLTYDADGAPWVSGTLNTLEGPMSISEELTSGEYQAQVIREYYDTVDVSTLAESNSWIGAPWGGYGGAAGTATIAFHIYANEIDE